MTGIQLPAEQGARAGGVTLIAGAVVLLVANVAFPRAADPWDVPAVLMMMVDDRVLRQASFLAVTAGLWAVTAGLLSPDRWLQDDAASARIARHLAVVGVTLFTTASALGMAATGAAVEWVAAGAEPTGPEYAVAAALNHADDAVWFLSLVAYWGALALYGRVMVRSAAVPQWLGAWVLVVGTVTAVFVGLPLTVGVEVPALLVAFGVLGGLTTLWALTLGVWMVRATKPR